MIFMMKNCYNIEQNKWSTIDTIYNEPNQTKPTKKKL